MSAEDRLEALAQLVTVMQGEVLNARAAATQAEQRATGAEIRSLALRKPKSFDGTSDSWRLFKLTFLGYAGVFGSRLKQAIIGGRCAERRLRLDRNNSLRSVNPCGHVVRHTGPVSSGTSVFMPLLSVSKATLSSCGSSNRVVSVTTVTRVTSAPRQNCMSPPECNWKRTLPALTTTETGCPQCG